MGNTWQTTATEGLLRHKNGRYYARLQVLGKRKFIALKTTDLRVAKLRILDEKTKALKQREQGRRIEEGFSTVGDLMTEYLRRFEADPELGPAAKKARREHVAIVRRTWPGIEAQRPAKISVQAIYEWSNRLRTAEPVKPAPGTRARRTGYAPQTVNKVLESLQRVLRIGVEKGLLLVNPFELQGELSGSLRKKVEPKAVELPSRGAMEALFCSVGAPDAAGFKNARTGPGMRSQAEDCEELARGLAYSGMRLKEASRFTWEDIQSETFVVRGTKSASSRMRTVPIVPAMRALLDRMRGRRVAKGWPCEGPVFRVSECAKSLTRACATVGVRRLTHHDLRHYFATTCIESGVDIPTVSRWLGHADGGALAMRVYGHLRQEHSIAAATKVSFGEAAS